MVYRPVSAHPWRIMKRKLQAGDLDRQIVLQSPTVTRGSRGQQLTAWTTVATVWAYVESRDSKESQSDRNDTNVTRREFTIRYLSAVGNDWRLQYEGNTYRITGTPFEIGRQQYLVIRAEHTGGQASE